MHGEPPPCYPVSADFLDIVRTFEWEDNHLGFDNPHVVGDFFAAHPNGEWQLIVGRGLKMTERTYTVLCAGEARPDGSFVSGGKTYKLGDDGTFAVLVG